MTAVLPETSLKLPIYTAATRQRTELVMMGPGVEIEVHEQPDSMSVEEAVLTIINSRQQPLSDEERYRHIAFDWAMDLLHLLNPGGVARTTKPAPLTTTDLVDILERVAKVPEYQDQTIMMEAQDHTHVALVHGEVTTSQPG